jgi:predicted Zn-dependent protease
VYKASELGGQLVYKYAGGVGTRYGDSTDVQRLLLAGLYQQAMQDRAAKRPDAAAQTLELMTQRFPGNPNVQLLRAESQVLDLKDGKAALATLAQIPVQRDNRLLSTRVAFLKADAYVAAGFKDSARVTLEALNQAFPDNPRVRQRLEQLKQ